METKNLCGRIEKIVKTSGTTNDWWSFTLGMEDFKAGGEKIISDNMKALSEMGFSWTICDVQPKNLDISYFNDLPISTITISRQLIYKLPDTHKTIRAILDMAKVFDMRVIADGIETPEQIKIINSINIESEQNKTHLTASGKIHEMSGKIIIPLCSFDDLVKILYKRKQLDVEETIGRG
jgi:EAL domain-containing protein (putative c-di-GMP-specific phosphodiesterase class I)